jgi:uncharacterized protein (TIGR02117 family)
MLCAFVFSRIPVNKNFKDDTSATGIEIYLLSNGVHTDVVLPIRNICKDWGTQIKTAYTLANDTSVKYAAIGWGDKGFYLDTPEWSDLKFSTAFNAMFFLSSTAMHVTLYRNLYPGTHCKKVRISAESYRKLVLYIDNSFQKTDNGNYMPIKGHYDRYDCFFEARGTYNLFYTCNCWTNSALKHGNLKACLWTPFDKGILFAYKDR